jgi:hypothetical protein
MLAGHIGYKKILFSFILSDMLSIHIIFFVLSHQTPLFSMLAGFDWLPAGFGRWSSCQATGCMLSPG